MKTIAILITIGVIGAFLIPAIGFAPPSIYYFLKYEMSLNAGDSIISIIEIESDSTITTPAGYTATTEEDLNELDLLTCTQSFSDYDEMDENIGNYIGGHSWLTKKASGSYKKVYSGSATFTTGYSMLLKLITRSKCLYDNNPSLIFTKMLYKPDSSWYTVCGQVVSHQFVRIYPNGTTAQWNQTGWHGWSGGTLNPPTSVTVTY